MNSAVTNLSVLKKARGGSLPDIINCMRLILSDRPLPVDTDVLNNASIKDVFNDYAELTQFLFIMSGVLLISSVGAASELLTWITVGDMLEFFHKRVHIRMDAQLQGNEQTSGFIKAATDRFTSNLLNGLEVLMAEGTITKDTTAGEIIKLLNERLL